MADFKKENYENGAIEAWSNDLPILRQLESGELVYTNFHNDDCKSEPQFSQYLYQPKPETIMIGDDEIVAPISDKNEPKKGYAYFVVDLLEIGIIKRVKQIAWNDSAVDNIYLISGLLHSTSERAQAHAKALIKISGGKV